MRQIKSIELNNKFLYNTHLSIRDNSFCGDFDALNINLMANFCRRGGYHPPV